MFDVKNLYDAYFAELNTKEILEIKELPINDKIKCFDYFLNSNIITNTSVLANLFILINGMTSIADDTISDNKIFFNSIEEYVDIKLELKSQIDNFKIKIVEYYLGIIQGLHIKSNDMKIHITNTYFGIFQLMNLQLIAKLMAEFLTRIDIEKVKPTFCAEELYYKINNQTSLVLGFLQNIVDEVKLNDN